ncbi:hypothetical protein FPQ18DRAFT_329531 [Pyronema domesticum]|nr:hypothetical protein FPQ18DRAFT_329531 [Pyronema domesticum]
MEVVDDYIAECERMTRGMPTAEKIAWYRRRLEIRNTGHRRDAILRRINELSTNANHTSMMSISARLIRSRSDSISSTSSIDSDSSIETIPRFRPEVTSSYISSSASSVPARSFTTLPRPFTIHENSQPISAQSQSNQSFQGVYLTTPDLPPYIPPVPHVHTISSNSSPASQDLSNRAYSSTFAVPFRWDAPTTSTAPPATSYVPLSALPPTPTHTPGVTNTNPALLANLIPPTPSHTPGLRNMSPVVPATWIPPAPPPMPAERTPEIIIFGASTPSQPASGVEQANPTTTTPAPWSWNNPATSTNPVTEQRRLREVHRHFDIGANISENNRPATPERPSSCTGWNSRTSPPQSRRTWTVPSSPEAAVDNDRWNRPASPAPQADRGSSNVAAPPANEQAASRLNDVTVPEMVELPNRRRNFSDSPVASGRDNAHGSSNEVVSGWDNAIPSPAAENTGTGWDLNDVTTSLAQEQSGATTEGWGDVTSPANEGWDCSPPSDDESGDEWHNARTSGDDWDSTPAVEDKPEFNWSNPSTWART